MGFFDAITKASLDISKGICDIINNMPESCQGYRINYNKPYHEKCPDHGCTCYQTFENPTLAYCPKCGRVLIHEDDRW